MPRKLHEVEYEYDEYDEHEDVRKLRRPQEDGKKIEKTNLWEHESVPDYDERR
jgi:hypothetical protein